MHARVGIYKLNGPANQIYENARDSLLAQYKKHPGFVNYELIESGENVISISHWGTKSEAETAVKETARWVKENIAEHVSLISAYVGEVEMSSDGAA